jgi:hypothetical protein
MSAAKKRRRKLPDPEHYLVAIIRSNKFSYFIASRRFGQTSERIDDEAIIELNAEISEIRPLQREHVGEYTPPPILGDRGGSHAVSWPTARPTSVHAN